MVFHAYIVKQNRSKSIRVAAIGLGCVLVAGAFYGIEMFITFACFLLIAGFVLLIIGAIAGGGKDFFLYTKDVLSVSSEEVTIAGNQCPMQNITNLSCYYHSFYSQSSYGYYYEHSGMIELGMNNSISFTCDGRQVRTLFSIADINQANNFFHTVKHLQESGIAVALTYRQGRG